MDARVDFDYNNDVCDNEDGDNEDGDYEDGDDDGDGDAGDDQYEVLPEALLAELPIQTSPKPASQTQMIET